jgi:ribosomal protein L37E
VYIEEFNSSRYVIGNIPQKWANDIFSLVNKFSLIRENDRISEPIEIQKIDIEKIEQPIKNTIKIQELCPICGANIFSDMNYCGECGKSLLGNEVQPICSRCGAEIESRMNFCGNCGLPLISS